MLEPLGPQHNEADYQAWTSSLEHIRVTPGFGKRAWPHQMSTAENLVDLERHERDFAERVGFAYAVLDLVSGDVIGCVYIYPVEDGSDEASVRSWVRADRTDLDVPLWRAVSDWLASDWPFRRIEYAARAG
jgi:hypothetical protein